MRVVFVHGACVRDGGWWWHLAGKALLERGVSSSTPGLPSCGENGQRAGLEGPGLSEDVAAVRDALTASDEPTAVVGHSYGGIVAAEAAVGVKSVRHMVFVSSYLPEPGGSLSTFGQPEPPPFLSFDPTAGTFSAVPELFEQTFVQDCPPDIVREGAARLVQQSIAVTAQPVQAVAWHDLPTTYMVCTEDRGTPAAAQRKFAQRADKAVEVMTGHHPFLSQPKAVTDLLASLSL